MIASIAAVAPQYLALLALLAAAYVIFSDATLQGF